MNTVQPDIDSYLRIETLPEAPAFHEFLRKCYEGKVLEVYDRVLNSLTRDSMAYDIFADGKKVGVYRTYPRESPNEDFTREFRGVIPGHVNKVAQTINEHIEDAENKIDESSIILSFSNERLEMVGANWDHVGVIKTPWQRQDDHPEIPFP